MTTTAPCRYSWSAAPPSRPWPRRRSGAGRRRTGPSRWRPAAARAPPPPRSAPPGRAWCRSSARRCRSGRPPAPPAPGAPAPRSSEPRGPLPLVACGGQAIGSACASSACCRRDEARLRPSRRSTRSRRACAPLAVLARVDAATAPGKPAERRRLRQGQLARPACRSRSARRRRPRRRPAQVDVVEVQLEDLVLVEVALDLPGDARLHQLPADVALAGRGATRGRGCGPAAW